MASQLAGALGQWLTQLMSPAALKWILGLSFIAMLVIALNPDLIRR